MAQKTFSQLQKEAKKAPKYVLKMDGLDLYIADKQPLFGCELTENVSEALEFSVGYDNEEMKSGAWTATAQRITNCKEVIFKPHYL